jgi:lipoprotein signal peptidase
MTAQAQRSHLWLFWFLAAFGLVADQASKYGVHALLFGQEQYRIARGEAGYGETWGVPLIPSAFDLQIHYDYTRGADGKRAVTPQPHVNHGAVNGWKPFADEGYNNYFFALVSLIAACAIVYWIHRPAVRSDRILSVALGLILGGTLGNLYDRMVFGGVRDFLHWYLGINWPDFNVADSCLVCGAGLLLLHALFVAEERPASDPEPAALPARASAPVGQS